MFNQDIVKPENLVYKKTDVLTNNVMHYCQGCGHGTTHRIIAEVIEETKEEPKTETVEEKAVVKEENDLTKLTVTELKAMAKDKSIEGYSKMKKEELLEKLK